MPFKLMGPRATQNDVAYFERQGIHMPQHGDISVNAHIGAGVRIWEFTVICDDVVIENDVVIGSHCFIGHACHIGKGSRLQSHVFLAPGTWVGENVFIGPGVITTDDKHPKVNTPYHADPPCIGDDASIGAGAVLLPGVQIGVGAVVGAGAIVTHHVEGEHVAYGNPATSRGGMAQKVTFGAPPLTDSQV